jgi:acetoin utilization protein AcuC
MFAATAQLLEAMPLERDAVWLGFSPQGAKHHAMWNYGSGFCTFNDMAYCARVLSAAGERVAYVDIDAHHGDGVEALCYHDNRILTASIHEWGIFPGTGAHDVPEQQVWNYPLDTESGDTELVASIAGVVARLREFQPTVLLIAAGADGHETDPLSSLRYTLEGYQRVARGLARAAADLGATRILVGGAGGYQPDDVTPLVWATFVNTLATELEGAVARKDVHNVAEVIQ